MPFSTKKQTIAIVGSNGMLGSDLINYLSQSFTIFPINKDNYQGYSDKKFDILINANGNSKRYWANQNIFADFEASTISVYKTLFDFKFKKYIYISSSDVYENHSKPEFTKENKAINSDNLSVYGLHKYLSELIVRAHVKDFLILRCSMILGTNLRKGPLFDLLNDRELFISKDSYLQMITTEEIANIIKFLIDKSITGQVYNLGGKGNLPIKKIEKYFTHPVRFSQNVETQEYEMSINKLDSIYHLKSSEHYLQKFIKGYNANKLHLSAI